MKISIALPLALAAFAFSNPPTLLLHYSFSAGARAAGRDILVRDSLIYKIESSGQSALAGCKMAPMRPVEFRELLRRVATSRVKPTRSDSNYVCEGSRSIYVRTNRKSIYLQEACKPKKTAADSAIDSTMDALSNYLGGIVERKNVTCEDGYYFNLIKHDPSSMTFGDCLANTKTLSRQELDRIVANKYFLESMTFPPFPLRFFGDSLSARSLGGMTIQLGGACFEIEMKRQQGQSFKRLL